MTRKKRFQVKIQIFVCLLYNTIKRRVFCFSCRHEGSSKASKQFRRSVAVRESGTEIFPKLLDFSMTTKRKNFPVWQYKSRRGYKIAAIVMPYNTRSPAKLCTGLSMNNPKIIPEEHLCQLLHHTFFINTKISFKCAPQSQAYFSNLYM